MNHRLDDVHPLDRGLALHLHPGPPGAAYIGYPKIRPSLGDPLPEAIDMAVAAIRSADYLTAQQKSDILYHNAARFLRLQPAERTAPEGAMETLPR